MTYEKIINGILHLNG